MTPPTLPTDPTDIRKSFAAVVDVVAENTRAIDRIASTMTILSAAAAAVAVALLINHIK